MFRAFVKLFRDVTMARKAPTDPLVVIIGATGTGKSQLAVDLATRFNGEIINGDAMQMYDGLPIITNKITKEEQQGIRHHLLGIVGLNEDPWRVGVFKKKAGQVIKEIRSRGKLPIVVGGTHYYTQSLLFDNTLVSDTMKEEDEDSFGMRNEDIIAKFPILETSTEEILEKLREVDPAMADRWHPKDHRKIRRSLEIYLMSGKKASDVYEEQRLRKKLAQTDRAEVEAISEDLSPESSSLLQSTVIFWVHSEAEVLKARLNSRVDKMVENGLLNEVEILHKYSKSDPAIDYTRGIWVSIGFKEFEAYFSAIDSGSDFTAPLADSIERTKSATRQYARTQARWIRTKLMANLLTVDALQNLYLLDGSQIAQWSEHVSVPAIDICRDFLLGNTLPSPESLSPAAGELLAPKRSFDLGDRPDLWVRKVCDICKMTAVTEEQWESHLKGRKHRGAVKRKSKAANSRQWLAALAEKDKLDS